jgi:GTP-sensing pleiotropic transcriptional regulator CodY
MSFQKNTPSILSTLLFRTNTDHPKGRVVRFDENVPDIKLSTGSISERIIAALERSTHPLTAKEIADCIGTSQPRSSSKLRQLISEGIVAEVKLDGCITEYLLINDPKLNAG